MPLLSARSLLVLAMATLVPRVVLAVLLGVVGEPERWEYDVIAANIASGAGHVYDRFGFVYAAYAPPLWSGVLAALLVTLGEGRTSIQVLQAFFCLGAAVACSSLTRRLTGDDAASLFAGLLVALQPSLLYYSVAKSDPLPLNALLLVLIANAALSLIEAPRDRHALLFGFLTGLGVLSRGTPVVALPLVIGALLARRKGGALRAIVVSTSALAICLAPWMIRNVAVLGAPIITSTTGENFWRGNHDGATGGVRDRNGGEITHLVPTNPALPTAVRRALETGDELNRHEVFMSEAWRFIRAEPLAAMELCGAKLRTFWWRIDSDPRDYPPAASIAYAAVYRTELAFALLGMFMLLRTREGATSTDRAGVGLVLALMIAVGALQCAFYVQGRHRFLIEPLLLVFTATGIVTLARGLTYERPGPTLTSPLPVSTSIFTWRSPRR